MEDTLPESIRILAQSPEVNNTPAHLTIKCSTRQTVSG